MKLLPASPWDFLTATARDGKVRFDARKGFEAGAFLVSTWGFVFLILADRMSEFYFVGYLATWTAARFLRDREKRLANGGAEKKADDPDATTTRHAGFTPSK